MPFFVTSCAEGSSGKGYSLYYKRKLEKQINIDLISSSKDRYVFEF